MDINKIFGNMASWTVNMEGTMRVSAKIVYLTIMLYFRSIIIFYLHARF